MGYGPHGYFAGFDHGPAERGLYAIRVLEEEININNSRDLEQDITRFIDAIKRDEGTKGIILDLGGVGRIDSSGVGMLVTVHRYASDSNFVCALADVGKEVYRVLKLTAMTQEIFRELIFKSVEEAYKNI
ncbi:MAG: STAS domain-containing protein [bacterium]